MIGWKTVGEFSKPKISCKMMTKILYGNFQKSFLKFEKMTSRKIFWHFLYGIFYMFVLKISNHTVFLFNLELICMSEFNEKLKVHSPKRLVQFQLLKNSLMQINSKLNSKPHDYMYLYKFCEILTSGSREMGVISRK